MRFVVMTLLVFVAGAWSRRFRAPFVAWFAVGLVTLAVEMVVMTAIGVKWSVIALMVLPVAGLVARFRGYAVARRFEWSYAFAFLALLIYALTVLSAATTSGDFVFFWGTKGQQFGQERMLDTAFLRNPDHVVMHPEYPPLVPLYYAWTMLGATELDWFGALSSAILFLALATFAVPAKFQALFASMFALLFIRNDVAGNAEPALIFFEVVALGALLAKNDIVAAIALSGAALTKLEGAVFAVIVIALLGRRWKVALPPLIILGLWLLFANANGLLASSDPRYAFSAEYVLPALRQLAGQMSFGLWYLPWIAIAVMYTRSRESLPYIAAALAFLAFMVLTYARPEAHMEWSAQRVLMTPLVLFFFSAITRSA